MLFTQYYLDCLSQASYLIADETTRRAVVVDPRRDVAEYVEDARAQGLTIEGVINTHFHADFVAGHLELAEATGAWIGYGDKAATEYAIRPLRDGERISLGEVTLEILHTPGHTPESISVVVREHPDDAVPYGVLTGDALFIGDVGRPDLLASVGVSADELARMLHDSVQHKLMALPDETRVFPAHGAGSACGKNLSTERQSTIGIQRLTNYACRPMDADTFVALVTEGQSAAPPYFAHDADLNRRSREILHVAELPGALSVREFLSARAAGAVVVDARDPQDFAAAHFRGSLNIPADGRFAETAGSVLEQGRPVLVVAPAGHGRETVIRLARVGIDTTVGHLDDVEEALLAAPDEVTQASRLTVAALDEALGRKEAPFVLDVRTVGELEAGRIPLARNIPLAELTRRIDEVPGDRPVVVHCAGGYRSSVAASVLRAHGRPDVSDLLGGYSAYGRAHAGV